MLGDSVEVEDIVGLKQFLKEQDQIPRPESLVYVYSKETVVEDTELRTVKEKQWFFSGFELKSGDTNINHFPPTEDALGWLAGISQYLSGKVEFIVLDEGDPRLDVGWATLVEAEKGVAKATPLELRPVGKPETVTA